MNTKHTPGPWVNDGQRDDLDREFCIWSGAIIVAEAVTDHNTTDQVKANTHLIASAPDLLAKCGMALDVLLSDGYGESSGPVTQLRAAIATATGNK